MTKALVLLLALTGAAQAAPHGIYWVPGQGPVRTQSERAATKLLYYGGPVISHAKVYVVFWGDGVSADIQRNIGPFYANILDSSFMDWLSEYATPSQTIGRGRYMGSVRIQPLHAGSRLTDADIQAELDAQIAAGRLAPADADTLYMIYFPAGVSIADSSVGASCQTFCAYHEGFKSKTGADVFYGVMPYCDSGCGTDFDSVSSVSSHEAIEAVTDPFPTPGSHPAYPQAWNTATGDEIADVCTDAGSGTVTGHGIVSTVQALWDNRADACIKGPWSQAPLASRLLTSAPPLMLLRNARPALLRWDGR